MMGCLKQFDSLVSMGRDRDECPILSPMSGSLRNCMKGVPMDVPDRREPWLCGLGWRRCLQWCRRACRPPGKLGFVHEEREHEQDGNIAVNI